MLEFFAKSIEDQTKTSANDAGTGTDINVVIGNILKTVFVFIGVVAVIMIIIGGVNYLLSRGDPGKVKKGKETVMYGLIGLLVSVFAYAIVFFVTNVF